MTVMVDNCPLGHPSSPPIDGPSSDWTNSAAGNYFVEHCNQTNPIVIVEYWA